MISPRPNRITVGQIRSARTSTTGQAPIDEREAEVTLGRGREIGHELVGDDRLVETPPFAGGRDRLRADVRIAAEDPLGGPRHHPEEHEVEDDEQDDREDRLPDLAQDVAATQSMTSTLVAGRRDCPSLLLGGLPATTKHDEPDGQRRHEHHDPDDQQDRRIGAGRVGGHGCRCRGRGRRRG